MRASLRGLALVVAMGCAAGCPDAHDLRDDAGTHGATPDAAARADAEDVGPHDAAASSPDAVSSERVRCGPNLCSVGEICCSEHCGICAFADECVDFGCAGP
ncbi:MAG: hypothetical protein K1X94_27250 [Sandaracinaceae bacterium]|nr:hypothetical protein [Sandaracinaceae bacterium]